MAIDPEASLPAEPETPADRSSEVPEPSGIDPASDDAVAAEHLAADQAIEAAHDPATGQRVRQADAGSLRFVIVVWCFWLLGAWGAAWLSETSVPRVRWMLFAGSFGLMLVWPAFRLSEAVPRSEPGRGALQVFLDWLAMIGVYQAVIWSLYLLAGWPLVRGVWLDAAVVSWSLLSALIVAGARLWPGGGARLVGMALCVALVFAEPVFIWLSFATGGEGWAMRVSPIQALWELTRPTGGLIDPWDKHTLAVALTAAMGWSALALWSIGERIVPVRRRGPANG
ncbi:MAG: hypothetical protein ACPGYV_06730 [Phycisphaeraceae bacterium]